MRRLILLALSLPSLTHAGEPTGEFKLPPQATAMPFPDRETALSKARLESPWCMLLDGPWRFHFSEKADQVPSGFETDGFDIQSWKEIPVPSNWDLQGYGTLQAAGTPSSIGVYRRTFVLPAGWKPAVPASPSKGLSPPSISG